jgi:hypothetical protein
LPRQDCVGKDQAIVDRLPSACGSELCVLLTLWHLRDAKADTTANEYMQELPESLLEMVGSVYLTLAQRRGKSRFWDLQQNATKPTGRGNARLLKGLVGTAGFEPTTSTG